MALFSRAGPLTPSQRAELAELAPSPLPQNARALDDAAKTLAKVTQGKGISDAGFESLKEIAQTHGASQFDRSQQIRTEGGDEADRLLRRLSSRQGLLKAPELRNLAFDPRPEVAAPALIELTRLMKGSELQTLPEAQLAELREIINPLSLSFVTRGSHSVPVPRRYMAAIASANDCYRNAFDPHAFARAVEYLVNRGGAELWTHGLPGRASARVVQTGRDPRAPYSDNPSQVEITITPNY